MTNNCDSWESLTDVVQERCVDILDKVVAPIAKEIVRKHIDEDIYSVYTPIKNGWVSSDGEPITYKRRNLLLKNGSIYHRFSAADEIMITSDVTASPAIIKGWSFHRRYPGAFLKLLETGNMGIWRRGFPRPAIRNAQREIDNSSKIRRAIRQELNK